MMMLFNTVERIHHQRLKSKRRIGWTAVGALRYLLEYYSAPQGYNGNQRPLHGKKTMCKNTI